MVKLTSLTAYGFFLRISLPSFNLMESVKPEWLLNSARDFDYEQIFHLRILPGIDDSSSRKAWMQATYARLQIVFFGKSPMAFGVQYRTAERRGSRWADRTYWGPCPNIIQSRLLNAKRHRILQPLGVRVGGMMNHLIYSAFLHDLSAVHDDDPVHSFRYHGQVMCDQDQRTALFTHQLFSSDAGSGPESSHPERWGSSAITSWVRRQCNGDNDTLEHRR